MLKKGKKGSQLRAMLISASMPGELAAEYSAKCRELSLEEKDSARKEELLLMASNLKKVPWNPPRTFWEAVQALWITHMLVMQ